MTDSSVLRVAMAQINLTVGDIAGNCERILAACNEARDRLHARLVVFPELTVTGYPPEDLLLRPTFIRQAEEALTRLAAQITGIQAVIGHPLRADGRLYNAASVVGDGRLLASYRKQLLPNYGVFDEKRYFVAGHEPCVLELGGVRIGLTVCEDVWEPGPVGQAVAAGAELVVNLNASPYHRGKENERLQVLRARLAELAHGVPIIYVNLVGGQDELVFDGGSMVVDARGELTHRGEFCAEALYPVDFERGADGRLAPRPGVLLAPPPDEAAVYRAIILGTRDYVNKNGFPGVVLGLSGGIDSALTLAVAVDALGAERVMAVAMPSRYTTEMSSTDAERQARALGVEYRVLPIEKPFQAFLDTLEPLFAGRPMDVTEENIQARCRGVLLMAISNKTGRMVLTTSNKSETAVGYATLYGDMAGGFAPIKDVPKTLVYRLAAYRNGLGEVIPQRVFERPPSAELRPDQTDQDSLPPYDVLDAILEQYVERDRSVDEIVAMGYERGTVERVARLVIVNEYKRRQAAPGVRITPRAFGRDRRYPITSGFRR
ncbi:MAG TPA: NAD+ synthase [Candidatus Competibacteraceae bacterium]|nr:NAD+ synthase [Candidatus Competibacteraceae bacterium]